MEEAAQRQTASENGMDVVAQSDFAMGTVRRFQRVLDDFVEVLGNMGALAAIDVEGVDRYYFAAGATDRTGTEPATKEHSFQIGSQSKTFVAVTLLLMQRAGQLSLDDPVVDHLDLNIDSRITIRHLVTNSSGLGEFTSAAITSRFDPRLEIDPRDLVTLAIPQGQIFAPGDHFDYCNTGWVIAAMIIARVAAAPYQVVIRERILVPMGLSQTFFGGTAPIERMLRGYIKSELLPEAIDSSSALRWAYGGGDGVSNLDDMLSFYGSLIRPNSPIGISLRDLNGSPAKTSPDPYFSMSIGAEYGVGIEKRAWAGREVWGHPGSTLSYLTSTWVDAAVGVTVTTCVTRVATVGATDEHLRYPRAQLFALTLNTAYILAEHR